MAKTDVMHIRVEPDIKKKAEATLSLLGLSTSAAFNVFLNQVVLTGGLPFEIKLPEYNKITENAMKEAIRISQDDSKGYKNTADLYKELDS